MARKVASSIATSSLVKTAMYGEGESSTVEYGEMLLVLMFGDGWARRFAWVGFGRRQLGKDFVCCVSDGGLLACASDYDDN